MECSAAVRKVKHSVVAGEKSGSPVCLKGLIENLTSEVSQEGRWVGPDEQRRVVRESSSCRALHRSGARGCLLCLEPRARVGEEWEMGLWR